MCKSNSNTTNSAGSEYSNVQSLLFTDTFECIINKLFNFALKGNKTEKTFINFESIY